MALVQQVKVPLISVNDTSLTVVDILFANGDKINKGDIIFVFETSKTTYNVEAEENGYIQNLCEEGNDYEVNDIVANIYSEQSEVEKVTSDKKIKKSGPKKDAVTSVAVGIWEGETFFSVQAAALLESSGVDKNKFKGKDFVSKEDVEEILGIKKASGAPLKGNKNNSDKKLLPVDTTKVIIEKLSSNKKREIEYLAEVQTAGLTSTINTIAETDGVFVHINRSLKFLKDSLLPVIIYESSRLLKKYKELNAYYTGESIAYYNDVHVGFAVDMEKGLKVLKIANTEQKTIGAIEEEIMTLSGKYLDDTLQIDELIDISFTITDLSSESVAFFRPLINMMNSAILGVSSIDEKLNRCTLSVTFDHRVTAGKLVAQFLKELKERIESYRSVHHPYVNQDISCFKCYKTLKEDLSDVGFAKCITPKGEEGYICQSCSKGF
ncbi:MAG TPA: 2-oxo acid dehydrogenase subunit E2 [Ferruginibacter sp.]|jgi:pyruvate dehydrogenase E2 component (dihydrolipoamide acetyltransferase)|nr:2-oxo acid dehydrogenase subunit E2 [Ferruginibacter sp.]